MKKTFILFVALFMVSCSGEVYEDEIRVGEDNLAYVGDTEKLYSGDVLDKYGKLWFTNEAFVVSRKGE